MAAGYGDYVRLGSRTGLEARLLPLRRSRSRVRHHWHLLNAGIIESTSNDWRANDHENTPSSYFHKLFDSALHTDAEIVIVVVGAADSRYY